MRKLNRVRERITNMLVQRSVVFSSRMFGHSLAGMRKLKVGQAHKIVKDYIMKYSTFQDFMTKSLTWHSNMKGVQNRLTRQILRRRYKKQILCDYWKAIIDRCTKLKLRNQTAILKKMNCLNLELIPEKRRDDLINTTILIQEEKYVQNLKKFQ